MRLGSDGVIRSATGEPGYEFWCRYLDVFDTVTVLARVSPATENTGNVVTGPSVSVSSMPGYTGMIGALRHLATSIRVVKRTTEQTDTVFLARIPGLVGGLLAGRLRRVQRPYGLEVVGDPRGVFRSITSRRIIGVLLGELSFLHMRRQCSHATAVSYVTREHLQRRYPAKRALAVGYYSSINLPDEAFQNHPHQPRANPPILVTVGTQSQRYKGHDLLLSAAAQLISGGTKLSVRLVGYGHLQPSLLQLANSLGISEHVSFVGQLPSGSAVRAELDAADIFVLPSRTEGLPRALIEAMARGLPCVASAVGGVPELLEESDTVTPGSASALADRLSEVIADPARRARMGTRNLAAALEFSEPTLRARRIEFYESFAKADQQKRRIAKGVPL